MPRLAVGFGSNIGDRRARLDAGLAALSIRWTPISRSSLYESAPIGPVDQDPFLNAVAVFATDQEPAVVLSRLLAVERGEGRTRAERWGPRTLDLDLLLYETRRVDVPGLTVPHPELANRRFVLEPLLEAWPEAALPDGTPVFTLLGGVADQEVHRAGPWGIPRWRTLSSTATRLLRRAAGTG